MKPQAGSISRFISNVNADLCHFESINSVYLQMQQMFAYSTTNTPGIFVIPFVIGYRKIRIRRNLFTFGLFWVFEVPQSCRLNKERSGFIGDDFSFVWCRHESQ